MPFDIEINDAQLQKLGKAIAIASVTAMDDYVSAEVEKWPESIRAKFHVPAPGETDRNGNPISQVHRFEVFRAMLPNAERAIAQEAKEAEQAKAEQEANRQRRQEQEAATLERNLATYDADLARWKAECVLARQQGLREPPQPAAPPLTADDLAREAQKRAMQSTF